MKKLLVLALAFGAVAAPIASAHDGDRTPMRRGQVEYVFKGVVGANAAATSVSLIGVRARSRHARLALGDATTFTVKLDGETRFRRRGARKARFAALRAGTRILVVIRARRGIALTDLPAAREILLRGVCHAVVTPPVVEPPAADPPEAEPPAEPPVVEPPAEEPIFS